MIRSVGLKGFKAFFELNDLEFKPITVLCGQNSSGKSSILQSILLMKQTRESRNFAQSLLLNGKYVHLGSIKNALHGGAGRMEVVVEHQFNKERDQFEFGTRVNFRPPLEYLVSGLIEGGEELFRSGKDFRVRARYAFSPAADTDMVGRNGQVEVSEFEVVTTIVSSEGVVERSSRFLMEKVSQGYDVSWSGLETFRGTSTSSGSRKNINVDFENLNPAVRQVSFSEKGDEEGIPVSVLFFLRAVDELASFMSGQITYLGPLREEPARRYFFDNEVVDIGVKGENAAYIYQLQAKDHLRGHYFYNGLDGGGFEKRDLTSVDRAVAEWMEILGVSGFSSEDKNDVISLGMQSRTNTRVNIADVGFGVSQIFPVILEGLRMPKGSTLLLEQPEIHLHPNMQMQMADYFISLALSGKNIVLETHSDHVVNRLIRRVVEDESGSLGDMIAVYFVSGGEKGSTVEKVQVDGARGIVNWPKGFFDQAADEQRKIIQAGLNKRRKLS